MDDYKQKYETWRKSVTDERLNGELNSMSEDDIKDAFSDDLSFGTGGLRGIMSPGTNRMNVYTVYRATEGIARYMLNKGMKRCAITFDSRINSKLFCQTATATLTEHGIEVYITDDCMPTPFLSFMVRYLKCDLGINITASHNPSNYNGYKVYDGNGCQLTDNAANEVTSYIESVNMYERKALPQFSDSGNGLIRYVGEDVENAYIDSVLGESIGSASGLTAVYTPLNGAGYRLTPKVLGKIGLLDLHVVDEQSKPDGNFPTCPYPNPEKAEALKLAIDLACKVGADIVIANDPDSDRLGVAVKHNGEILQISGNEVGILLLDYILSARKNNGTLPSNPLVVKTIVTSPMVDKIASTYGAEVADVLTGFKYIGDVINKLEQKGETDRYVFGFEESCGYLKGTYVRDKDGVVAAALIAEAAAHYKRQNKTLIDRLNEMYAQYGDYLLQTISYRFDGADGAEVKRRLLKDLRNNPLKEVAGQKVIAYCDFLTQTKYDLPKSDVMRFNCVDYSQLIIRPSGTEPLIKCYITTVGDKQSNACRLEAIKKQLDVMFCK